MNSVDLSTPDKLMQWRFPHVIQDYPLLTFVKKILATITGTAIFNNCESVNPEQTGLAGHAAECYNVRIFNRLVDHCKPVPCELIAIGAIRDLPRNFDDFHLEFDENFNIPYLYITAIGKQKSDTLTILNLKTENEKCECYNVQISESGITQNLKCDNLTVTDLSNKIEKFLKNSILSDQTTNTPLTSDPFSNAGPTPQPSVTPNNGGQSTQPPIPATPSPDPSNAGPTPQPSATPNNGGQSTQPPIPATPSPGPSSNAGQTPQPSGSPSNNPTSAPGNSGQSNTGPQNSNPPPTPNYNRAFILAGGTAVLGGGLAYAGYKARQAQAPKTKDGSTKSLQYSSKFRA